MQVSQHSSASFFPSCLAEMHLQQLQVKCVATPLKDNPCIFQLQSCLVPYHMNGKLQKALEHCTSIFEIRITHVITWMSFFITSRTVNHAILSMFAFVFKMNYVVAYNTTSTINYLVFRLSAPRALWIVRWIQWSASTETIGLGEILLKLVNSVTCDFSTIAVFPERRFVTIHTIQRYSSLLQ